MKTGEWLGRNQVILGNPVSKSNNYRSNKGGNFFTTDKVKNYNKSFWAQCEVYRNRGINKPFIIELDIYFKSILSDIDNPLKCILDNLQMCGAIMNDRLCYKMIVNKYIDSVNPRIEFKLKFI